MTKIIGNTTATPNPQPDWNQTDETKADYIKNKPTIESGEGEGSLIQVSKEEDYLNPDGSWNPDKAFDSDGNLKPDAYRNGKATAPRAIALGANCSAEGKNAIAFGGATSAIGHTSISGGNQSKAYGKYGVAIGEGTAAGKEGSSSDGYAAVALGSGTNAIGKFSMAINKNSVANGQSSLAGGEGTIVDGKYSFGFGYKNTSSGDYSYVFGNQNIVDGKTSIIGGQANTVSGAGNLIAGHGNNVITYYSLITGENNFSQANQYYSLVQGTKNIIDDTNGHYKTVLGTNNTFKTKSYPISSGGTMIRGGYHQFAKGANLTLISDHQIVFGNTNQEDASKMFILANGTTERDSDNNIISQSPNNIFTIDYEGNVETLGTIKAYGTPVDDNDVIRLKELDDAISLIVGPDADEALDTIKEIQELLEGDTTGAAGLIEQVNNNAMAINNVATTEDIDALFATA